MISSDKMQEISSKMGFTHLSHFADTLEQERRKVLMFQRELPLCLELLTHAIDCCRHPLSETTTENRQSECSDHTSREMGLVLEEFIPINRNGVSDFEQPHSPQPQSENNIDSDQNNFSLGPSDWLRSAQLWNQTSDPPLPHNQDLSEKTPVVEVKRNGGAFRPFHKEKTGGGGGGVTGTSSSSAPAETSSTAETGSGGSSRREEKEAQNQRKQRRCWSPELHRRFLHALQQLGGSHAATPKQIRELMKVDGLTNDEVKSHLQKYRLHTRRPSPTIHNNQSGQTPQFLVVGGIWVPAAEYTAVSATTSSGEAVSAAITNRIHAPMVTAAPPQLLPTINTVQKPKPTKVSSSSAAAVAAVCKSPTTSSSTHTSSVSPVS